MYSARHLRVLTVCGGNTCRSPALSLLLAAELRRRGHENVEVLSAGANERLATNPRYAGPMNAFAIEALREIFAALKFDDLVDRAHEHTSHGLSKFRGEHFELIAFVDRRYFGKQRGWKITAGSTSVRWVPDRAYGVWKANKEPTVISQDSKSQRVLRAYRKQTAWLSRYAADLASHVEKLLSRIRA